MHLNEILINVIEAPLSVSESNNYRLSSLTYEKHDTEKLPTSEPSKMRDMNEHVDKTRRKGKIRVESGWVLLNVWSHVKGVCDFVYFCSCRFELRTLSSYEFTYNVMWIVSCIRVKCSQNVSNYNMILNI